MTLSKRELIEWFESGSKAPDDCQIGMEHEVFVYHTSDWRRVGYKDGIAPILQNLQQKGWSPILEGGNLIALRQGNKSITLEPAGQFELSGAPTHTLHETKAELDHHISLLQDLSRELNIAFIPTGFEPLAKRDDLDWMPKGRYEIMKAYMPTKGSLGLDMMTRTCTVQANLDYTSEADMVAKMRVAMALQPVISVIFAASPFKEGKRNGFQSYREHIWQDTDPDRCGILPFVFEDSMGFDRYAEYLLDLPMYFIYRDKKYINRAGDSFRQYMKTPEATLDDFVDHNSTAFPEIRLKRYLEMRGADAGPVEFLMALPALWVGLLYASGSLKQAQDLTRLWSAEDVLKLYGEVPQHGFATSIGGRPLLDVARDVLKIAVSGLKQRGLGEEVYLLALEEVVQSGWTLSDRWVEAYETRWEKDVRHLFQENKF